MTEMTLPSHQSMGSLEHVRIAPHEYNQWQRKRVSTVKLKERDASSSEEDVTFVIGRAKGRQKRIVNERRRHSCFGDHHGVIPPAPKDEEDRQRDGDALKQLKILDLLIKSRRKALQSYLAREEALLEENAKMQDDIEQHEKKVHGEVTSLLQRYERYRGAVTTLTSKFEQEKAQAQKELDNAAISAEQEIAVLNNQVRGVEVNLETRKDELSMLMGYKDREYPVKAMHISQLQKRIDRLKQQHKRQLTDLRSMVQSEKDKYHRRQEEDVQGMREDAANDVMDGLQDEIKDMAVQNITMRKEIEDHLAEKSSIEGEIPALERVISALKIDPSTDIRKQMFPHLYEEFTKCTPDMDIVLDIPTRQEVLL